MYRVHWANKLLYFDARTSSKGETQLECKEFTLDHKSVAFSQQTNSVKRNLQTKCHILACAVVQILQLGLYYPCLLLQSREGKHLYLYYYVIYIQEEFKVIGQIKSKYRIPEDVKLMNGPLLCYMYENVFYFAYPQSQKGIYKLAKKSLNGCAKGLSQLTWIHSSGSTMVVMVTTVPENVTMETDSDCEDKTALTQFEIFSFNFNAGEYTQTQLDTTYFIPDIYVPVITIVKGLKLQSMNHGQMDEVSKLENNFLVLTKLGQLIQFENGKLIDCVNVSCDTGVSIYNWEVGDGRQFAAARMSENKLHIISLETFEVVESYDEVSEVLQGDWINCGRDQLAIVCKTEQDSSPDAWDHVIITDGYTHHLTTSNHQETAIPDTSEVSDNLYTATQALKMRLQTGQRHLETVQKQHEVKGQIIEESIKRLQQLVLGENTQLNTQTGMIPFLGPGRRHDGGGDALATAKPDIGQSTPDTGQSTAAVRVMGRWQRLVGERWLVGAEVLNTGLRIVENVQLIAVTSEARAATAQSCVIDFVPEQAPECHLAALLDTIEPSMKRSRHQPEENWESRYIQHIQPHQAAAVVCVTEVPSFTMGKTRNIPLLLRWTETKDCQSENVIRKPNMKKSCMKDTVARERVIDAGTVAVQVADIIDNNIQVKIKPGSSSAEEMTVGLVSLQARQSGKMLTLSSPNGCRVTLSDMLQCHLGFVYHTNWQMLICPEPGALHMIRVDVKQISPKKTTCIVYTKDDSQLVLLVHAIYGVAPDDVIILPSYLDNKEKSHISLLAHMDRECCTLEDSLRDMITEAESNKNLSDGDDVMKPVDKTHTDPELSKLQSIRKDFSKKQKHFLKESKEGNIDGQTYSAFRKVLNAMEDKTDSVLKEFVNS